jgi:23S rRNA pseudouridine2605 synthase
MTEGVHRPGRRVQLHRALSKLGWGSRTQAWEWVRAGEVCVDGRVVADPLAWVDLDRQRITRGGAAPPAATSVVLALHKPRGVLTTRRDERGRRTVYDLLPPGLPWVFPAGRLDADSEGLLILTSDAALAVRLTEPAHRVPKTYRVTLDGPLTDEQMQRLRSGVDLSDGRTQPAEVRRLAVGQTFLSADQPGRQECVPHASARVVEIVLTEGRNRQVRRMLRAVGRRVRRLVRVAVGGLELGDLPPGACRVLDAAEKGRLLEGG